MSSVQRFSRFSHNSHTMRYCTQKSHRWHAWPASVWGFDGGQWWRRILKLHIFTDFLHFTSTHVRFSSFKLTNRSQTVFIRFQFILRNKVSKPQNCVWGFILLLYWLHFLLDVKNTFSWIWILKKQNVTMTKKTTLPRFQWRWKNLKRCRQKGRNPSRGRHLAAAVIIRSFEGWWKKRCYWFWINELNFMFICIGILTVDQPIQGGCSDQHRNTCTVHV